MITSLTLVFALVVGVVGVRVLNSVDTEITIDSSYLSLLEASRVEAAEVAVIESPEMNFREIRIPVLPKVLPKKIIAKKPVMKKIVIEEMIYVSKNELPFNEPVTLKKVSYNVGLLENMVALYNGLPVEEKVLIAEEIKKPVVDEVKTVQASTDAEPEFFEYESKPEEKVEDVEVAAAPVLEKEKLIENIKVVVQDIQPVVAPPVQKTEEPKVDMVAFDYSGLRQDIRDNRVPTVSMVDTHRKPKKHSVVKPPVQEEITENSEKNALVAPVYETQMTIQGVATDLRHNDVLRGFEVRFQDNTSESFEDYGDGEVSVSLSMSRPKMTRSMVLLKRGFAPTNTDLILEEGAGSVSIPVLSQELLDTQMAPFERTGPVGALLVELADETEKATLDVPFGKVITLDGDMRETSSEDFRYQLFVGVKAGNALLSYVHGNEITNKIVHVHEREVTFESNFFEKEKLEKVSLFQEDLLSREKSPLVTASENVRVFAKNIHGQKLNQNTYRMDFGRALMGGRNYIELAHESEPVFVGTKNETNLSIPSEGLMRHILSSLPDSKLGNRCVIQVNTKRKIADVSVAAESVGEGLMVSTQYLDADGRFYESASEKTRKIIMVGENQSSDNQDMSGKVNLKITYLDGSQEFLGSYCSPNTYLVEQL